MSGILGIKKKIFKSRFRHYIPTMKENTSTESWKCLTSELIKIFFQKLTLNDVFNKNLLLLCMPDYAQLERMGLKRKGEEYCIHAQINSEKTDKMLDKASNLTVT